MALRKSAKTTVVAATAVSDWSVADLSALYAEQRSSLTSQARRILRSDADAAEIVQEAFLKFILAAPELDTRDRALAYLRTTVNHLCLNQIRASGSRPNLVAIDSDTSQERLNEIAADAHIPFDSTLAAAEDAAIIREALSRLSPDQRTALVMWEMEGRTTEEIAAAIGTTPANVRHVVGRARASFVRILTEWVIDDETGATALDALSSTYKKAAELAKKSSKAALSLVIVLVAFLGFNSITGHEGSAISPVAISQVTTPTIEAPSLAPSTQAVVPSTKPSTPTSATKPSAPSSASPSAIVSNPPKKTTTQTKTIDVKTQSLAFGGLGKDGVPIGFTATDTQGHLGKIIVSNPAPKLTSDGLVLHTSAMSYDDAAINVLLDQTLSVSGAGSQYSANASVTINHSWTPLNISSTSTDFQRLEDGTYLVTATMQIESVINSGMIIPANKGIDVLSAPSQIIARIHLNATKSQILAQAIQVSTKSTTSTTSTTSTK
jgi:RNA polymerase sigma factor (sigma-70 family)